jgi:hypothetical protein
MAASVKTRVVRDSRAISGRLAVKTMLIISYLMGGHVIDTQTLDAANMDDCNTTKHLALAEKTPITTRYGSNVKISAECRQLTSSAER